MNACGFYEGLILAGTIRAIKNFMREKQISFVSTYKCEKIEKMQESHHIVEMNGETHFVIYKNDTISLTIAKIDISIKKRIVLGKNSIDAVNYIVYYGSVGKLRQAIGTGDFAGMISFLVSTEEFKKEISDIKKISLK